MVTNKLKDRLLSRTSNLAEKVDAAVANRPADAPARANTMPAQLGAFRLEAREYQERIQKLTDELEQARKAGGAMDVPLADLHEVPGRRRHKSPEEFAELRENLRNNKLIHPVAIRARLEGGFEIVSGHWRTDAYRELGRATIRCVLDEGSEDEATVGAFYANLLQSDLTDYEKYLGFKDIHRRFPDATHTSMADSAGVSRAAVTKLMSFEHLPQPVLEILQARPSLLTANYGLELARLTREGKAERVVEAVNQLAAGKIDQTQAVKFASADPVKARPVTNAQTVKIKAGRSVYCSMRTASKVLRLEFQSEEDAQAVQEELRALLERRAEIVKTAQSSESEK
ncbi:MAG: ParB/RepB/Spo0J family partition protein [Paraburkholderia sp.]|uniref:ParB/RepB/Spo0J family partition protein n=1 Tax=Paraburkholderia sp. TaxID=1926495 RepID=UPI0011FC5FF2|nr:ParB/RepB/Spo0J family partition protein [Paraburkholderia sp.]TAM06375.1 MAG: ParB/RepB/Spo0J family partition protein [Paraburkholderia sp.]